MSEESERVKYLLKYWSHLQLAREYEQLENIIKGLDNTIENLTEVLEKKDNIIKEVREYIEERKKYKGEPFYLDEIQTEIVCEILDKGNK